MANAPPAPLPGRGIFVLLIRGFHPRLISVGPSGAKAIVEPDQLAVDRQRRLPDALFQFVPQFPANGFAGAAVTSATDFLVGRFWLAFSGRREEAKLNKGSTAVAFTPDDHQRRGSKPHCWLIALSDVIVP